MDMDGHFYQDIGDEFVEDLKKIF